MIDGMIYASDHSFSTYAKFSEKQIFFTQWYAHVRVRGVKNVSFSENFAYVLNEWFPLKGSLQTLHDAVQFEKWLHSEKQVMKYSNHR